ncbi:sulfotransferase-like domain-containing protein [Sneathiella chinensis]|uniref:Branched chain amino acid aminotransferase n=1 Tax=Sneathiella chinensis TaxID=349750 RepID=A0ABQ5U1I4_9PROT|nr:HAD family hydrolase [Sneathiella chinensis]GLQ05714.1 branched chain amino acid aminotransferase [Sneathiella chinensis]
MTETFPETRLSMWSGPRNISTAMMRSFGNRSDCLPVDEPYYAWYLKKTGLDHPMKEAVIASQPTRWQTVTDTLNGPLSDGKTLLYIKHMSQHMLDEIDLSALAHHTHCFLLRDPRLVIASFAAKWDQVSADATGFERQVELYTYFAAHSPNPVVVVEGEDILRQPREMLELLCQECGLPFDEAMLEWPSGPHPADGVWGKHWYGAVEASTGFQKYTPREVELPPALEKLADQLRPSYEAMKARKITL